MAITIQKLEARLNQKTALIDYQALLKTIKNKDYKKIVIPELGNRRIVNLDDIIAFEADGAYSKIHLLGGKLITTSKNLKYFEEVLPKETSFFRSHRTWIVNTAHLTFLNKTDLSITLAKGTVKAKMSRARIRNFEHIIQQ